MRGGVQTWKRGKGGRGIMAAVRYVEQGTCDASHAHEPVALGADAAAGYAEGALVERFVVTADGAASDALDRDRLTAWLAGHDPDTGTMRGRNNVAENSAMVYDATVNLPKSFSIAAILDEDLRVGLSVLQDKIRDHSMSVWAEELYVRRGTDGGRRVSLAQVEVAELRHERSRSLDPHIHRHMWLNARAR